MWTGIARVWPRLVHYQSPAHELPAVAVLDRSLCFFVSLDFYETKTTRFTGKVIANYVDLGDRYTRLGEPLLQFGFARLKRDVSNKQLFQGIGLLLPVSDSTSRVSLAKRSNK